MTVTPETSEYWPRNVLMRCPACTAAGQLVVDVTGGADADDESLVCESCDARYPIIDGIPRLFVDDWRWRSKQAESDGWAAMSEELGQTEYGGAGAPAVDFVIPHIADEPWRSIGASFDAMVADIDFAGMTVLDIGAGRPWAAKQFALRGATAMAIDVNAHPVVGLGRGREMMREAGVEITLLVGDSESLPVADEQLDVVFISAAMHHTNYLRRLAREMARVLKPGGSVLIINEPARAGTDDEADLLLEDAELELRHGITERRPSAAQYLRALSEAGLVIDRVFLDDGSVDVDVIRPRLTLPALAPIGRQWLHWKALPRLVRSVRTRWRHKAHELELRAALPRSSWGVRDDHALMMSIVFGRNIVNIRASKPGTPSIRREK